VRRGLTRSNETLLVLATNSIFSAADAKNPTKKERITQLQNIKI
jgi:hypothetical protein